jgi:hypothetical protein
MWVKVDDDFTGHPKIFRAGAVLGGDRATGRVLAVWLEGMCWANHYLTGGRLLATAVLVFQHDRDPAAVAAALEKAGLWDVADGGWQIHDYDKYQLNGPTRGAKRQVRVDAGRRGGLAKASKRSSKPLANDVANGWQNPSPDPDPDPKDQDQNKPARKSGAGRSPVEKPNAKVTAPCAGIPSGLRDCPSGALDGSDVGRSHLERRHETRAHQAGLDLSPDTGDARPRADAGAAEPTADARAAAGAAAEDPTETDPAAAAWSHEHATWMGARYWPPGDAAGRVRARIAVAAGTARPVGYG